MTNGKHYLTIQECLPYFFILLELAPFSAFGMEPTFGDCAALPKVESGCSAHLSCKGAPTAVCSQKGDNH